MSLSVCVGTAEERRVLEKAEEFGCQREQASVPQADVEVEILPLEVQWGEDFDLELQFTNRSSQHRVVNIYISGNVVYYTGVPSAEVIFETPVVKLGPQQSKCVCLCMGVRVCLFGISKCQSACKTHFVTLIF